MFLLHFRVEIEFMPILLYYLVSLKNEYFYGFKQANRKEDDISIVNAGIRVKVDPKSGTTQDVAMAFGGMAPTTVMATTTCQALIGRYDCNKS